MDATSIHKSAITSIVSSITITIAYAIPSGSIALAASVRLYRPLGVGLDEVVVLGVITHWVVLPMAVVDVILVVVVVVARLLIWHLVRFHRIRRFLYMSQNINVSRLLSLPLLLWPRQILLMLV